MTHYLLIQSRDPFEAATVKQDYQLAGDLATAGHQVTLFCVQNGVLPTRKAAVPDALTELPIKGVTLLADDFSLRERGIAEDQLADNIEAASLDRVVDHLASGAKTLWL
jgi:predicted peroxiredoxin